MEPRLDPSIRFATILMLKSGGRKGGWGGTGNESGPSNHGGLDPPMEVCIFNISPQMWTSCVSDLLIHWLNATQPGDATISGVKTGKMCQRR